MPINLHSLQILSQGIEHRHYRITDNKLWIRCGEIFFGFTSCNLLSGLGKGDGQRIFFLKLVFQQCFPKVGEISFIATPKGLSIRCRGGGNR